MRRQPAFHQATTLLASSLSLFLTCAIGTTHTIGSSRLRLGPALTSSLAPSTPVPWNGIDARDFGAVVSGVVMSLLFFIIMNFIRICVPPARPVLVSLSPLPHSLSAGLVCLSLASSCREMARQTTLQHCSVPSRQRLRRGRLSCYRAAPTSSTQR